MAEQVRGVGHARCSLAGEDAPIRSGACDEPYRRQASGHSCAARSAGGEGASRVPDARQSEPDRPRDMCRWRRGQGRGVARRARGQRQAIGSRNGRCPVAPAGWRSAALGHDGPSKLVVYPVASPSCCGGVRLSRSRRRPRRYRQPSSAAPAADQPGHDQPQHRQHDDAGQQLVGVVEIPGRQHEGADALVGADHFRRDQQHDGDRGGDAEARSGCAGSAPGSTILRMIAAWTGRSSGPCGSARAARCPRRRPWRSPSGRTRRTPAWRSSSPRRCRTR